MGIVDFKTKQLAAKVYTGKKSKPHPGQGSSWYNKKLKKQLNATNSMNFGSVVIWDSPGWKVVKKSEACRACKSRQMDDDLRVDYRTYRYL